MVSVGGNKLLPIFVYFCIVNCELRSNFQIMFHASQLLFLITADNSSKKSKKAKTYSSDTSSDSDSSGSDMSDIDLGLGSDSSNSDNSDVDDFNPFGGRSDSDDDSEYIYFKSLTRID